MSALHVFTDDTDWVIAESAQHALDEIRAMHGDDHETTMRELPDDQALRIHWDGDSPNAQRVTKTCREWVEQEGEGFLCSTEY
jgi:hypothetical protein